DVVEQRFLGSVRDVHASYGNGDHVGARRFVRLRHYGVGWVLPGADDETRLECFTRYDKRISVHYGPKRLSSAHEVHDFDAVAFADQRVVESGAFQDDQIVLDGDASGV